MSAKKNHNPNKQKNSPESKSPSAKASPLAAIEENKKENVLLYYIGLAIVLLLIFIIRKNYFNIPFERDEGSYAYAGKIILDGAIPFTDIGSQRLDGVFYAYSVLVWIFGYSIKAIHIAFLLINLASAVMIFFLTRKLSNYMAGLAAAGFFALLSMASSASGFTTQSEHIVVFLILASFLFLFEFFESKKIWQLIISGILFSFAFEVKQTCLFYGVLGGALLLFKGFFEDKSSIKKNLFHALIFSFSIIFPVLFDLLMVYKNGAWADFNLWLFDVAKQYTTSVSFDRGFENFKINFLADYNDYKFFWIFSFIASIGVFFTGLPLWKKIAVLGLNIAGFLTIIPGYHFQRHYFLQWFPAVCISAAIFIFLVQDLISRFKNNTAVIVIPLLLIIIPICINLKDLSAYYFKPNLTLVLKGIYGLQPFLESKIIADKLNSVMKKEDRLAIMGTEIEMYVYTNKKSPSRFAGSGALLEFPIKQSNDWQKEFIADVEKAAPRFLIFYHNPVSWCANPKTENLLFPWFDKYTAANYKLYGYADMLNEGTNYIWEGDPEINNPPKAQFSVYIFERK